MLLGILLAMLIAVWLGAALLPIVLVGAMAQTSMAYALTRNAFFIRIGFAPAVVFVSQYLVLPMLYGQVEDAANAPISPDMFTALAYAIGALTIIIATVGGVLGARQKKAP